MHGLFRGSGVAGKGSAGRSTVAGDRVATGTPFAGKTPVVSGYGEVERARRSTVDI
jgi:S-adenosylhomocysteine hydrolase